MVTMLSALPLHGGEHPYKDRSLWQLTKYKSTTLLRQYPLCWCPYRSYVLVDRYVTIENRNNLNWIIISTDLEKAVRSDSSYNRRHSRRYKGTPRQKVRQIYQYCKRTRYVLHFKTARNVIEHRKGDCAGIASAFYVLCKKNQIPCRYVIGWCDDELHAWNRVKLGRRWYWIDATLGCYLSRKQFEGRTVLEMW